MFKRFVGNDVIYTKVVYVSRLGEIDYHANKKVWFLDYKTESSNRPVSVDVKRLDYKKPYSGYIIPSE